MHKSMVTYFTTGFILGAVAGAAIALLSAPVRGEETRQRLKSRGLDLRERSGEVIQDTLHWSKDAAVQGRARLISTAESLKISLLPKDELEGVSFEEEVKTM